MLSNFWNRISQVPNMALLAHVGMTECQTNHNELDSIHDAELLINSELFYNIMPEFRVTIKIDITENSHPLSMEMLPAEMISLIVLIIDT